MSFRAPIVVVLTLCACRDHPPPPARPSPLETGIARDLTSRLSVPVSTTCTTVGPIAKCEARLLDGTKLPLDVKSAGKEWEWRVSGIVVDTSIVATHVREALADLKLAHRVSCGARIQLVQPGDRIGCMLSGGGMAFVQVAADGSTALELALDATSAAARAEPVTPERDRTLTKYSLALEALEGESDGEEAVPSDGGVPSP